jgi:sec-independent protein translocase protein TatA
MGHIGFQEILLIVVVLVILFGARRIPELARSMGRGIMEFKKGLKDEEPNPGQPRQVEGAKDNKRDSQ